MFMRFQELLLCSSIVFLVEQFERRFDNFSVNELGVDADNLPVCELIANAILLEPTI